VANERRRMAAEARAAAAEEAGEDAPEAEEDEAKEEQQENDNEEAEEEDGEEPEELSEGDAVYADPEDRGAWCKGTVVGTHEDGGMVLFDVRYARRALAHSGDGTLHGYRTVGEARDLAAATYEGFDGALHRKPARAPADAPATPHDADAFLDPVANYKVHAAAGRKVGPGSFGSVSRRGAALRDASNSPKKRARGTRR